MATDDRPAFPGFPSADQIALAIVTAARLTEEDPVAVVRGEERIRARVLAMDALLTAYPSARRVGLATCLGFRVPRAGQAAVISARTAKSWREDWADEVLGAVVAPLYGEAAE